MSMDITGPVGQRPILDEIALALAGLSTPETTKLILRASGIQAALGASCWRYESDGKSQLADGAANQVLIPGTLFNAIANFREASYAPDYGTWFTLVMTLTADGQIITEFDYDTEPLIVDESFTREEYVNELEQFPRSPGNQPSWLQNILTEDEQEEDYDI